MEIIRRYAVLTFFIRLIFLPAGAKLCFLSWLTVWHDDRVTQLTSVVTQFWEGRPC